MIQQEKKNATKKRIKYLDVSLINGAFELEVPAVEKMVLIAIASESKYGKYKYSPILSNISGCGDSTTHKSITSLINRNFLHRTQRGEYLLFIPRKKTSWVNIEQFRTAIDLKLRYIDKLVLLASVKFISNKSDSCFPKISTLSKQCSLAPKTISKSLTVLKKDGLIDRYKDSNRWHIKSMTGGKKKHIKSISGDNKNIEKSIPGGISKNIIINNKKENKNSLIASNKQPSPCSSDYRENKAEKNNYNNKSLHQIWKETIPLLTNKNSTAITKLTGQELGQLKMINEKWGENQADKFLYILNNWEIAVNRLKNSEVINKAPAYPKIWFILKHAVDFDLYYLAEQKPKEIYKSKLTW